MPIPISINDLSPIDSVNSPQGSDPVGGNVDDYFRAHAGILARQFKQGADIASAAALPIPIDGTFFNVTGAVGVTSLANTFNGKIIFLRFTSALTLTNSASLVMPGNVNYTTFVGEILQFVQFGASQWACISHKPSVAVDGSATMTAPLKVTDGTNTASYPADGDVAGSAVPQGNLVAMNTNLQNQINTKVAKAGDTMTGALGLSSGASNATLPVDGNLSGTGVPNGSLAAMNSALSGAIGGKSNVGAIVQYQSATVETGSLQIYSPSGTSIGTYDMPSPYVMTGLRVNTPSSVCIINFRGRALANG